jgi:DNA-binding response OmpR family regulator
MTTTPQGDGDKMSNRQIMLLVTSRATLLESFAQALRSDHNVELITIDSAEAAVEAAVRLVPVMAIIDQELPGGDALEIVQRMLSINAFIHTAVLTDMDEALFHERSEGLGILAGLPLVPDSGDAEGLLVKLREMVPV